MSAIEGIDRRNVDEEKDNAINGQSVCERMGIEILVDVVDGLGNLRNGEVETKKTCHDSRSIKEGIAKDLEGGKERFFQFGPSPHAMLLTHSAKH